MLAMRMAKYEGGVGSEADGGTEWKKGEGDELLARLRQLRRTLHECSWRVEQVDHHVYTLHPQPEDLTFHTLPEVNTLHTHSEDNDLPETNSEDGQTPSPANQTHPGDPSYKSLEPLGPQGNEQELTVTELKTEEGEEKGKKQESTTDKSMHKCLVSEVKEAEEHLVQTEWTVVSGELTEVFEVTNGRVGEKGFENGVVGSDLESRNHEPQGKERPKMRRQHSIDVDDYEPTAYDQDNTSETQNGFCDPHSADLEFFRIASCPDLRFIHDKETKGTSTKACGLVTQSDTVNSRKLSQEGSEDDSERESRVASPLGLCNSSLDISQRLEDVLENLECLRVYFISLQKDFGYSTKTVRHRHCSPGATFVPVEAICAVSFKEGLTPSEESEAVLDVSPTEGLKDDVDVALPRSHDASTTPRQRHSHLSHPKSRGGEACTNTCGIVKETFQQRPDPLIDGRPNPVNDGQSNSQHDERAETGPAKVRFNEGRRHELKESLTTVMVIFLLLFGLLFLACCLLLVVVPVVPITVTTSGRSPVF